MITILTQYQTLKFKLPASESNTYYHKQTLFSAINHVKMQRTEELCQMNSTRPGKTDYKEPCEIFPVSGSLITPTPHKPLSTPNEKKAYSVSVNFCPSNLAGHISDIQNLGRQKELFITHLKSILYPFRDDQSNHCSISRKLLLYTPPPPLSLTTHMFLPKLINYTI